MPIVSNFLRATFVACLFASAFSVPAFAAEKIENFDAKTWRNWTSKAKSTTTSKTALQKPAVVVFSTTDCGHCPGIIAALSEQFKQAPKKMIWSWW